MTNTVFTERQPDVVGRGDTLVTVWDADPANALYWSYSLDAGATWHPGREFAVRQYERFIGGHSLCFNGRREFYSVGRLGHSKIGITVATFRGSIVGSQIVWTRRSDAIPYLGFAYHGPDYMQILATGDTLYLSYIEAIGAEGRVKFTRSTDGGATWSAPIPLDERHCSGTRSVVAPNGEFYVLWVDLATRIIEGRKSSDHGLTFEPFTVSEMEINVHNPPSWENISRQYLPAYPEQLADAGGAGLLSVAVDHSSGPNRGRLHAVWTEKATGTPSRISGGRGEIEPNDTPEQATLIELGQDLSTTLFASKLGFQDCDWLAFDGTAGTTVAITGRVCGTTPGGHPQNHRGYALMCGTNPDFPLGGAFVMCDQTLTPLVYTLPKNGRYYLFFSCEYGYVNYTLELATLDIGATSVARDHRDIVGTWSADGGLTWAPKRRLNDDPPFHDNSLPSVAVSASGVVHLTWYDRRDEPECSATVHTYWQFSEDGGVTFSPSVRLSDSASDLRDLLRGGIYSPRAWSVGDYMALSSVGESIYAMWAQPYRVPDGASGDHAGDLYMARIAPDSVITAVQVGPLSARVRQDRVELTWEVAEVGDIHELRLLRSSRSHSWQILRTLPARHGRFSVLDSTVMGGQVYQYVLEVVRNQGVERLGSVEVAVPGSSNRLAWKVVSANPSSADVHLELSVPSRGLGGVAIYDIAGQRVRQLYGGSLPSGVHPFHWDGHLSHGRPAPAGVYIIKAHLDEEIVTKRVIIIR